MRALTPAETLLNLARAPAHAASQARALRRPPREQRAFALRRMRRLVEHAYDRSPFYRAHYDAHGFSPAHLRADEDALRLVPRVAKADLLRAGPSVVDRRARPERLLPSVSSGTSGATLTLRHDPTRLAHHGLATRRMWRPAFRYRPWHVQAYVYTSPYPVGSVLGLYPLVYVPTLTPPAEIARRLAAARPHVLAAYPSHLRELLEAATPAQMARIRERLRLVSTNSEASTRAERDRFSEALGAPVLDEYSTEELGRVAAECPERRYHVFTDLVWLEDDGGRLVGWNLHEWTNPVLRYEQGDLGRLRETDCPCSWPFPELVELEGRANDAFRFPGGRVLTPGFLLDACYEVILAGAPVERYQMVHEGGDRVAFHYVARRDCDAEILPILERAFATRGGAQVRCVRAEELPHARRGAKWRPIVAEAVA